MSTDKFTFRDFFVFFLTGVSALFCLFIIQYENILLEINEPEYKFFFKNYSTAIGLLSIPLFYLLGHFIHGIDDLVNYWTKLIRGKQKTHKPKKLIFKPFHFIFFENRVNGHIERKGEVVDSFWHKFSYLQIHNQSLVADYWYVMNELFKGVTITCFGFGIYALFFGGKNEGYLFILAIVFWERAHYFAKRFDMNVTKVYKALQKAIPTSDQTLAASLQNKMSKLPLPVKTEFRLESGNALLMLVVPDKKFIALQAKPNEAEHLNLFEKDEFHITIIGSETGEIILKHIASLVEPEKSKLVEQLKELCETYNWQVFLLSEFYYIRKQYEKNNDIDLHSINIEIRESIIQLVKIPRLAFFYKKLNALVNQKFETPFPHLTLYTTSTNEDKKLRGIGIYSKKDFNALEPVAI